MMPQTIHAIYADQATATQAAERVVALGFPREAISIFGAPGRAHMGSFADSGPHDHGAERDHMGSFADSGQHRHDAERDHVGSFADSGPHRHDAERDRVGSFADSGQGMAAPAPIVGELVAAGLMQADAEEAARRLAGGSVLVVVQAEQEQASAVRSAFGMGA
jgi:hypothetical protein